MHIKAGGHGQPRPHPRVCSFPSNSERGRPSPLSQPVSSETHFSCGLVRAARPARALRAAAAAGAGRAGPHSAEPHGGQTVAPSCGSGAGPEAAPPHGPAFASPGEPLPRTAAARTRGLNGGRRGAERHTWGAGPGGAGGRERLALPRAWRPRGRALLSPLPPLRVRAVPGAGCAPRPPGRPGAGRGGARAETHPRMFKAVGSQEAAASWQHNPNRRRSGEAQDTNCQLSGSTSTTPVSLLKTSPSPERSLFLKYARTPTLEPDTMHARLRLSADRLTVRCGPWGRLGPTPALRFDKLWQVLGRDCYGAGRHYWEVDVQEAGVGWWVGAAYASLRRCGASAAARLGCNRQSWCLKRYDLEYWAFHDGQRSRLRPRDDPDRLGVYLDYEAGILSFYDVSGGMSHLHTFRAAFQEPLYPALRLWEGAISISRLP
ncbi:tripartite motif-containing protein 14 isoform X2 [Ailuropoda melanoleuca]|uniref:tripartite motif-containing protein 14 isoform X2 n=1 Tax=Ailuropoda melanoleuca TaxID=9646 RepID=UPI001493F5F9|nr:tripartite motif-containing protein 14 isoform X2 [Ailuropoda melanoleuca]